MILDKSFKPSDSELVTWGDVHLNLRSLFRGTQSQSGSWFGVHLTIFLLRAEKKRIYAHVQLRKILLTVDAAVILFVFNSIAREYSNFLHDILEVILLTL